MSFEAMATLLVPFMLIAACCIATVGAVFGVGLGYWIRAGKKD